MSLRGRAAGKQVSLIIHFGICRTAKRIQSAASAEQGFHKHLRNGRITVVFLDVVMQNMAVIAVIRHRNGGVIGSQKQEQLFIAVEQEAFFTVSGGSVH